MTRKEELRIAVAKRLGWTFETHQGGSYKSDDPSNWTYFHPTVCAIGCGQGGLPNWPEDLGACHEFEVWLVEHHLFGRYLAELESTRMKAYGAIILATGEERCAAFLKATEGVKP